MVTVFIIVLSGIFTALTAAFYIYSLKKKYSDPDKWIKIDKIAAMVVDLLAVLLSLASAHALNLRSKKIGFRLFSGFHVVGATLDVLYFSFMVRKGGFASICGDDNTDCKGRKLLIGWSVLMFLGLLVRLYAILTLWHCTSFCLTFRVLLPF
ncbi:hypothetical protein RQP46_007573 [Phenoliferia psychrophenolica]